MSSAKNMSIAIEMDADVGKDLTNFADPSSHKKP